MVASAGEHEYEKVVVRALRSVSDGPWTAADLESLRAVMIDDWCSAHAPDCKSSDVLEWLESLDEDQREELLFRANTYWNADRDRWALG
jgi:hypothetical protein